MGCRATESRGETAGRALQLDEAGPGRLDYYTIALSGNKPNVAISSSGSKLEAAWMEANGEDK